MEIVIQPDAASASDYAARAIARAVRTKPDAVLGLATGSTPERVYAELVRMHAEEDLSFSRITSFNLDEYVGLKASDEQSYQYYMEKHLFGQIDMAKGASHFPNGMADDIPAACEQYEADIRKAGGIDLQLLGIGTDGHIGFNEPTSSLSSRTRIKTLTSRTISDNARFFESEKDVPYHVVTMGIGTIRESREVLLLALGEGKAEAIAATVEGPLTAMVPASILQLHERATVVMDEAAAAGLQKIDYYKWVFDHKPDWQKMP